MSATGRGANRISKDRYPTPEWATTILCQHLREHFPLVSPSILEPCAGEGAIVSVLRRQWPSSKITTVEIDQKLPRPAGSNRHFSKSFLDYKPTKRFDFVITNPPYDEGILMPIVKHSIDVGYLSAHLLRIPWAFGGSERHEFRTQNPFDLLNLRGRRPSFGRHVSCGPKREDSCGWSDWFPIGAEWPRNCPVCGMKTRSSTSDATEYGWCIFHPNSERRWYEPRKEE